jgi:hypothetical protein
MARELKYPHRKYVRLSDEGEAQLKHRTMRLKQDEGIVLRAIIEQGLAAEAEHMPKKEDES